MSNIIVGTTTTTGYSVEADNTGALVIKTGPDANVAMIIDENQSTAFTGNVHLDGSKLRVSGGEAGQVWTSDGAGNNSWTDPSAGFDPTVVHTFTATQDFNVTQNLVSLQNGNANSVVSAKLGLVIEPVRLETNSYFPGVRSRWAQFYNESTFTPLTPAGVESYLRVGTRPGAVTEVLEPFDPMGPQTRPSRGVRLHLRVSESLGYNEILMAGESLTQVFMLRQDETPGWISEVVMEVNVAGLTWITPTVKWQGGSAPTSGTADGIDVYSFTILHTGGATDFTILASVTSFG
jgi:hypothetical protein